MTVAVTGATGRLGNVLVRQLLDKAAAELGFLPRPLSDSLRDTFEWFDREGKL